MPEYLESEHGPAKRPCGSCPYRKDVPSGVWHVSEYEKLPRWDKPMIEQPAGSFFCHQNNGRLCAGWVGCHDMASSLGLRINYSYGVLNDEDMLAALEYESPVPLHESGEAACKHGVAEYNEPSPEAVKVQNKVLRIKGVRTPE